MENVQKLLSFLQKSPTAFHAVETIREALPGYTELKECGKWSLTPGGKYYVTRNRSSVIAFVMPEGEAKAFQLVASHSDSPTFKIKENAEVVVRGKYVQLDTERYGGMLCATWMDRPLSIAGRVVVRTENGVSTRLVNLDKDMAIIPNVAIHMNRQANDGMKYQAHLDMFPLWGTDGAKGSFKQIIAETIGVQEEDVLGTDLYLYNRMPGTVWGKEEAFFSAGRLDDLECAYASVEALNQAGVPANHVNVCCVFDNEEVGSTTKQGANSTFLSDVLRRIVLATGGDEQDYLSALSASFMLSADNAHATHPNHPEFSDPVNQVFMNEGIVIKFNANQRYTTDGVSEAVFHHICQKAGVPVQHYANRSDMAGGGTLGNISGTHVSINTVDIGLAQLAMHSSFETAGTKDVTYMVEGMKAFYQTEITTTGDGEYQL